MKANFETMTTAELRKYVLENSDDSPEARLRQREAFYILMDRLNANPQSTVYPCPNTPENLAQMKQIIKDKLGK